MKRWIGHIIDKFTIYNSPRPPKGKGLSYTCRWYWEQFKMQVLSRIFCMCWIQNIIRYKIIFKLINTHKEKYSYLVVDLKEIKHSTQDNCVDKNMLDKYSTYKWNRLKTSISIFGLLTPIQVYICNEFDSKAKKICRYCVKDGNHRITILKELYQSDYKVKIKIHEEDLKLYLNTNVN